MFRNDIPLWRPTWKKAGLTNSTSYRGCRRYSGEQSPDPSAAIAALATVCELDDDGALEAPTTAASLARQ